MAKKRSNRQAAPLPALHMRKHLLVFGGEWNYADWCQRSGFRVGLDKTQIEVEAERLALADQQHHLDKQAKLHRNPKRLLEDICMGRLSSNEIDRPVWKSVATIIERSDSKSKARSSLLRLLIHVHDVADFLLDETEFAGLRYPYVLALVRLNDRRGQWRRPLKSWKPTTHNSTRQFMSLVRHLIASFPVPPFMDQAWFRSNKHGRLFRDWYIHIGSGKNIRTAKPLVPLTKLVAHHMMLAPENYSIEGAIRWGQVHAFGGDAKLADAVIATRIGTSFVDDEFWQSVIRFLVANPMLDRRQVGPIIDFLQHQKFEERVVLGADGRRRREPPMHPNLSMRGRTAESLLAQVERWHRALGRDTGDVELHFPRSGLKPLEIKIGTDGKDRLSIRQLLSTTELRIEGNAMRHCVSSYARSCASGNCSIWTMELCKPIGTEKLQTIEVSKDGQIVQSRGPFNRLPTASEFKALQLWANHAGLSLAPYVRQADD